LEALKTSLERREAYKEGRLQISGLLFLVMEAPSAGYPFKDSTRLRVDGCDMSKQIDSDLLRSLPPDGFVRSFFVNEWNSFIHIAAKEAAIVWKNDGAIAYR
jgi:hypothetical protein